MCIGTKSGFQQKRIFCCYRTLTIENLIEYS